MGCHTMNALKLIAVYLHPVGDSRAPYTHQLNQLRDKSEPQQPTLTRGVYNVIKPDWYDAI